MTRCQRQLLHVLFVTSISLLAAGSAHVYAEIPVSATSPDVPRFEANREFYTVSEKHPLTGLIVGSTKRFNSRLEAVEYRETLRAGAWVAWRYVGSKEPLQAIRFEYRVAAEKFVRTTAATPGGLLNMVLPAKQTRILPVKVVLEIEHVR